jgi:hypothetical protein
MATLDLRKFARMKILIPFGVKGAGVYKVLK